MYSSVSPTRRLPLPVFLLFLSSLLFFAGCSSSKPYAKLAKAGSAYTGSVLTMIDKTDEVNLEYSSYALLDKRATSASSQEKRKLLLEANDAYRKQLLQNRKIKGTAVALQKYFAALQAFADSNASKKMGEQVDAVLGELYGAMMAANPAFESPSTDAGSFVSMIAGRKSEKILREELIRRKETINLCTNIFRGVIDSFARDIKSRTDFIRREKYAMSAQRVFEADKKMNTTDIKRFLNGRKAYLDGIVVPEEVSAAKDSIEEFRTVFKKMTKGPSPEVSIAELDRVIADLKIVSEFIQSL